MFDFVYVVRQQTLFVEEVVVGSSFVPGMVSIVCCCWILGYCLGKWIFQSVVQVVWVGLHTCLFVVGNTVRTFEVQRVNNNYLVGTDFVLECKLVFRSFVHFQMSLEDFDGCWKLLW